MSRPKAPDFLVALDVGSSKVVALIGEADSTGNLRIAGLGVQPSKGLRRGIVVNIEATVDSIRRAVEAAELMANCRVRSAQVNITGSHIKSMNSSGVVPIRHREVTASDVDAVVEAASAVAVSADQQILHVVPQEFVVDGADGIHDPIGMSAVRLECKVHMVTGAVSAVQNLYKCVERCGLTVEKLVLPHFAAAEAVLSQDERELGIAMIDIGAGTSDIAVFKGGSIRHTAVLPLAGDQVTNDIAVAFRTAPQSAEEIKQRWGCALPQLIEFDSSFDVPGVGDAPPRRLSRHMLAEVMRPRYEELFRYIRKELHRANVYELMSGGIVLTGGAAMAPGALELAEDIFEVPVRLGVPHRIEGIDEVTKSPIYAASVGLLQYARAQRPVGMRGSSPGFSGLSNLRQFIGKLRGWLTGHL